MVLVILELFLQTQAGLELIEIHKPLMDLKAYSTTARQSRFYYGGKCVVCWWNLEAVRSYLYLCTESRKSKQELEPLYKL